MSEGGDGLHFNCVALFESVIQDSGSVDHLVMKLLAPQSRQNKNTHLPSEVLVVGVAYKEALRREGIRLNLNVSARELVDER